MHSGILNEMDDKFLKLQESFREQYSAVFSDRLAPHSVVVIPSLTLDQQILSKIKGHFYYEERMLCMLLLLKMPETHVTFVSSIPISPLIIDYYIHMLPGVTGDHAKNRLTLLSCYDAGKISLTEKVLNRPRLIERIKKSIPQNDPCHLIFFNVTEVEKELAVKLNMPIYGCDPSLNHLGSKSGGRTLFKECGIPTPPGFENLQNEHEIIIALKNLKNNNPSLKKAVIKINEGFSGDGNAVFNFDEAPKDKDLLYSWIKKNMITHTKIVAEKVTFNQFLSKFSSMGGIVEEFIEADTITSPSVQARINPLGEICIISTHDQELGGESGQVFLGATFPACKEYASEIASLTYTLSEKMREYGVQGRLGIDFISAKINDKWNHFAIEINLRKGGTTHPFLMLQFLTNGEYQADKGSFIIPDGTERFYLATDNLQNDKYKGLTPLDLIDIAMHHGIHFNHTTQEGVMFHLISALSQFGKLGLVSIGKTPEKAIFYYNQVKEILDCETSG